MATYRTCSGCLFGKGPCAEREILRRKVAGLGLTSIKWKCAWKRPAFRPGEPVSVRAMDRAEDYEDGTRVEVVEGYFVSETSATDKVVVYVDPAHFSETFDGSEMRSNGFMRLSRSYVSRREGVPASFCKECGNLSDKVGHGDWCKRHPDAHDFWRMIGGGA